MNNINKEDYIFVYHIGTNKYITNLMETAKKKLNLEINYFHLNNQSSVTNFLFSLINSKAVISNSFHGTIFSILLTNLLFQFTQKEEKKDSILYLIYLTLVRDY